MGVKKLLDDKIFLKHLKTLSKHAEYILTICTGSIFLYKMGLLDDKCATTNKRVFQGSNKFKK